MKLKKGVNCKCGESTPFSSWVFAHWNEVIEFICPKCNQKYTIQNGKVYPEEMEEIAVPTGSEAKGNEI